MSKTWRQKAAPLVARVIEAGRRQGLDGKALVRWCNAQFPWGPREYHPYKIWKSEVKYQLGLTKRLTPAPAREADLPGQVRMF